ncbi:phosphatidylinositol N-acetylglucosaminyltransferase subunit P-like [Triticum dicoccoides]|uniref:phosphatidylinositol N-acetylglucosaminyltransferase subunit P-like n=1 Tax=Triticum dicoccoides TaxID=85692 RepID=UPI00188DD4D7|nr:phosphatidylinositol N-acetylglucosaminyltransferase subunit P-like [Triticum dicoccoides]
MNKADPAGGLSKWAVLLTRASSDPDPLFFQSPHSVSTNKPSRSEAYGFVGSIAASATALAYIAWAYAPEPWLCHIGATYYPNKRWAVAVPAFVAVAVPAFVAVAVAQGLVLYVASNFLLAPPPACFNTISDEHAREPASSSLRTGADQAIEPIADIRIDRMNNLMFGEQGFHSLPR